MKSALKITAALLAASLLITGCTRKGASKTEGKISVVASIFPQYDWVLALTKGSDSIETDLLVKNGTDLHSYQPGTADIVKIHNADIFIYTGGESDEWVSKVLENSSNENQIVISLMEVLADSLKEEEIVEGMEAEEHEEEEEEEYDEHVWLSVENAEAAVHKIAEALEIKDLASSNLYAQNLASYLEELESLKTAEKAVREKTSGKEAYLIVLDRFPFRYLFDELGLKYYAAFAGCSAETEASFETVAFLAGKTAQLKPPAVFVTESSDLKLSETVLKGSGLSGVETVKLNSMQNITLKQSKNGVSYIELMKDNLSKIDSVLE